MREGINKKKNRLLILFFWNETNFSFIDELSTEFGFLRSIPSTKKRSMLAVLILKTLLLSISSRRPE